MVLNGWSGEKNIAYASDVTANINSPNLTAWIIETPSGYIATGNTDGVDSLQSIFILCA